MTAKPPEGILLIDKPIGITSFGLVARLRKLLNVQKIGHAGTLDPFATGVMVMLIGRNYTRLSDTFLCQDKEYRAVLKLGEATDTHDCEGTVISTSDMVPTLEDINAAIEQFQGEIEQTPPMFSAKKIGGKKLYELARQGIEVERKSVQITVRINIVSYAYPYLTFDVSCTKGTYVRSIGHDLAAVLGCGGHLTELRRIRSGSFEIEKCIPLEGSSYEQIVSALSPAA